MIAKVSLIAEQEYYTYNAEALLTLFWAITLTRTVFKFKNLTTFRRIKYRTSQLAKVVAVILPGILLCLLRLNSVQSSYVGFLILANFNSMRPCCIRHRY